MFTFYVMVLSSTGDVLCSVLSLSFNTNVTSITAYCERIFSGHLRWTDSSCQFSGFFYINLRLRLKVRWTLLYIRQDTLIQCSGYRIAVKKLQSATSVICSTERTLLQNLSEYKQHWSPVHLSRKKESANFSKTTVSRQNHATDSFTSGSVLPPPKFI